MGRRSGAQKKKARKANYREERKKQKKDKKKIRKLKKQVKSLRRGGRGSSSESSSTTSSSESSFADQGANERRNTDVLYGKAKGRVPRAPAGTFVIGSGLTTEAAVHKGKAQAPLDGVHGVKILNQGKAAALDGVPADGKIRNQAAALDGVPAVLRDGNFRNQAKAAALDGAGVLTVTAGRVANTPGGVAAVEAAVQ